MDTGKCITNMLNTRAGEHCLFRSFGVAHLIDRPGRFRRSDVSNACARWYPQVSAVNVKYIGDDRYDVEIRGETE